MKKTFLTYKNLSLLVFALTFFLVSFIFIRISRAQSIGGGGRGGGGTVMCNNVPNIPQSECTFTEGPNAGWKCSTSVDSMDRCLEEETRTYNCNECSKWDGCGYCLEYRQTTCTTQQCIRSERISITPQPTMCACYQCATTTPCLKCLTNAPLPPQSAKTCQCLSFTPKKDTSQLSSTNKEELSFECLVKTDQGSTITDYTVSMKSPSGKIINLKSKGAIPAPCPDASSRDYNCYKVETTSLTVDEKGKYEMIVAPQITCQ